MTDRLPGIVLIFVAMSVVFLFGILVGAGVMAAITDRPRRR